MGVPSSDISSGTTPAQINEAKATPTPRTDGGSGGAAKPNSASAPAATSPSTQGGVTDSGASEKKPARTPDQSASLRYGSNSPAEPQISSAPTQSAGTSDRASQGPSQAPQAPPERKNAFSQLRPNASAPIERSEPSKPYASPTASASGLSTATDMFRAFNMDSAQRDPGQGKPASQMGLTEAVTALSEQLKVQRSVS